MWQGFDLISAFICFPLQTRLIALRFSVAKNTKGSVNLEVSSIRSNCKNSQQTGF